MQCELPASACLDSGRVRSSLICRLGVLMLTLTTPHHPEGVKSLVTGLLDPHMLTTLELPGQEVMEVMLVFRQLSWCDSAGLVSSVTLDL